MYYSFRLEQIFDFARKRSNMDSKPNYSFEFDFLQFKASKKPNTREGKLNANVKEFAKSNRKQKTSE